MKLEDIKFSTPCSVPWEQMTGGGDQVRHCGICNRNVYNLSSMHREAAEAFLEKTEGRECVQLWKRPDGTIVTGECKPARPVPPPEFRLGGAPVVAPPKPQLKLPPPPPPPPRPKT